MVLLALVAVWVASIPNGSEAVVKAGLQALEPRPPEVRCGGGAFRGEGRSRGGVAAVGRPGCEVTDPRCASP